MLSNASVPHFYPSVFVLITDILDSFGELVYQRLRSRAEEVTKRSLPGVEGVREGGREGGRAVAGGGSGGAAHDCVRACAVLCCAVRCGGSGRG